MSLLSKQSNVSGQTPMPVSTMTASTTVTAVTGETIQLYYYSSNVLTSDAGQAAGTLVVGKTAYAPILDSLGTKVGNKTNSSLSLLVSHLQTKFVFLKTNLKKEWTLHQQRLLLL